MVTFNNDKIVVTIEGERDDYSGIIKAILFLMGNQNPETPPDTNTIFAMCRLLDSMMLDPEQIR